MERTVAIFPWGQVIEEFLDPLGLTAREFATRMRGGWLFGYVAALQRQQIACVIVCGSEAVTRAERLTHAETGAPIWLVPARRSGRGFARARPWARALATWARTPLPGFARVLREERCSAVIIQDYEHPRFDAVALLAKSLGLPTYASFQGGDLSPPGLEGMVRRRSLSLCDGLIVASRRERERLARHYRIDPARVVDVPNPVAVETWCARPTQDARRALGIPQESFLVVNHGRVDIHRKGLDLALEAWRQFAQAHPRAHFAIVGSGQDDTAFETLSAGVPQFNWTRAYVTDPGVIRTWLSAADAYLTLSRIEGMPVAPLEAMSCGLPVVASDTHGLADIFEGGEACGGLLVPRDSASAATAALARLHADAALRARLGEAARGRAVTAYSIDAVGRRLGAVLTHRQQSVSRSGMAACQARLGVP
jgi:glycosyltransferase involved in cell wall biosynthesis